MKHLLLVVFLSLLTSCVEQIEPIDENAEPTKILSLKSDQVGQTKANILLSLELKSGAYLEYGVTQSYGQITNKKNSELDHVFKLQNLKEDTIYHYRAVIVDKNLNRVVSKNYQFKTLKKTVTPLQITEVKLLEIKQTSAKVTWKTNIFADGIVYFGTTSNLGLSSAKVSILKKDHAHELKNLKEDTTYYYQVSSNGKVSPKSQFKTLKKVVTPPNPTPVALSLKSLSVASIKENSALVSWELNKPVQVFVQYVNDKNELKRGQTTIKFEAKGSQEIQGLEDDMDYSYRIIAKTKEKERLVSPFKKFKTLKQKEDPSLDITNLIAEEVTKTSAKITWKTSRPASSLVEYSVNSSYDQSKEERSFKTNHSIVLTGLTENTRYQFRVKSQDQNGQEKLLSGTAFTTEKDIVITVPTGSALTLYNFRINESSKNRIYFDSTLPLSGSSYRGFLVSGNTITGIKINSGKKTGHYFSVKSSFDFWDNNTIRYEGGSNLKDGSGKGLEKFTLQYIKNMISEPKAKGRVFFVTTRGSNSNSGTSESKAWRTVKYAATKVKAGDTVYIKAGNYGTENVVMKTSGRSDNPIKFIGYKRAPGDINSMYFKYFKGKKLDSSQMPMFSSSSNGHGDSAIRIPGKSNLIFRNIQVEGYGLAVYSYRQTSNIVFDNMVFDSAGRSNDASGITSQSTSAVGNNYKIKNIIVFNAGMSNLFHRGNYSLLENIKSYADSTPFAVTDYLIHIRGSHNILKNVLADRIEKTAHSTHGISVKSEGYLTEYNLLEDIDIIGAGSALELRHRDVLRNVIRNLTVKDLRGKEKSYGRAILYSNGASYNIIENIKVEDMSIFAQWLESIEDNKRPGRINGHHNIVKNCVVENTYTLFKSTESSTSKAAPYVEGNEFINCTFVDISLFFFSSVNTFKKSNKIKNSIFYDVRKVGNGGLQQITFENNNFYKSFSKPKGKSNISVNPNFVNASKSDFKLKAGSRCIDAGVKDSRVTIDFLGKPRSNGGKPDIGAFEYD